MYQYPYCVLIQIMLECIHTRTHARTHARTHTRTHARTRTHTYMRIAVRNARARQSEQYANQDVCCLLSQAMVRFYEVFLVFLFGTAIQQATANITKFMTGRLRPHFFDVCRPNYTAFSCVDARGHPKFILEDVCTVPDSYKALDMRLV